MRQIVRTLTMAEAGVVGMPRVLICDRDRKWSRDVRRRLRDAGIRVMLIPERAPNANAYAERFVRSIKEECLNRIVPLRERHFGRAVAVSSTRSNVISRPRPTAELLRAFGVISGSAEMWNSTSASDGRSGNSSITIVTSAVIKGGRRWPEGRDRNVSLLGRA